MGLRQKLSAENFLLASFYVWAVFSFISNSVLAVSHVLAISAIFLFLFAKKHLQLPPSARALLILSFFAVLSVFLNYHEISRPWVNISRAKYMIIGAFFVAMISFYAKKFRAHRAQILFLFLLSFFISAIWGLGVYFRNQLFSGGDLSYRPSGFFGMIMNYAYAAQFPALLIGFLVLYGNCKIFSESRWKWIHWLDARRARVAILAVFLLTLFFSQTRGAVLGFLVAAPFLFLWRYPRLFKSVAAGSALVIALVVWGTFQKKMPVTNRLFLSAYSTSNQERIAQYKMAIAAFMEKPVFGVGWRSLEEQGPLLKKKYHIEYQSFAGHAHNNFLEVLGTTGLCGYLAFVAWLVLWLYETVYSNGSDWRAFYLASIIAFVVSGLFQSTFIASEFTFTLFALYGLGPLFTDHVERSLSFKAVKRGAS